METETIGKSFQADSITIDTDAKITETAEYLTVEPVTIAREGVFPYEDGLAFKPGDELQKGAEVARTYLAWDHPPLKVITKPAEIKGFADNVHFVKDGAGSRVKARLTFYKKKLTVDQQELIRSKARRDVSVGFYYEEDRTPGKWNGQEYDYVQRNFVYDHVASVDHGRCAYPQCGIGVDANRSRIGNDPYPNEHACRMKDPGGFQPNSFRRITHGKLNMIIAKKKGESSTSLQAFRYPKSKWTAAEARTHCKKQGGNFEAAKTDQEDSVMNNQNMKEDLRDNLFPPTTVNLRIATDPETSCGQCIFYHQQDNACQIVAGQVSANLVCDEFTGKATMESMVRAMQGNAAADPASTTDKHQMHAGKWKLPNNPVSLMQKLLTMDAVELVDLHRSLHASDDFDKDSMLHRALLHTLKKKR